ncbi:site-specific integrase [Yinghuangia seranimata]|uniref:site-specific integrase n=1 Tax=Yinghuangia seranimata TaxID=408067 RepID=UPI00248AEC3F|nr:site-specific integrase [Yinghuangia seranimata]MDI2130560.1 site-specific integrase [Yinghuangia seranimata]
MTTAPHAAPGSALAVPDHRDDTAAAPAFALPGWSGLDTAARLALLDTAAADYVAAHTPPNTARGYADDWRVWQEYTTFLGIPELTGTPGAMVAFVAWLDQAKRAAVSTMNRRVTGATVTLRHRGAAVDPRAGAMARDAIKAVARRLSQTGERRGRGQAPPLAVTQLRRISQALPGNTLAGLRDRALLLVGFPVAARRRETASLRVGDVVHQVLDDEDGARERLLVHLRWVKTGARTASAPYGTHPLTCPVRAWRAWIEAAGIADDTGGPAFRPIDRHGNLDPSRGLSPEAVGEILKRIAKNAGVEKITGHSIRAGLATAARRAGHDAKSIADQGGWSPTSTALYGYMRIVDEWADNAALGLGL